MLSNNLVVIGENISDAELIQSILSGLGPKYESLVTTLPTDDYTFEEIQTSLLNHEIRMEHSKALSSNHLLLRPMWQHGSQHSANLIQPKINPNPGDSSKPRKPNPYIMALNAKSAIR
uniref:Retrovirus-related Pol polyprotein from transposon TNT 1-94 n=1 Tax=Nelumbo nucifera TaxID=4432 RepID=A0A822XZ60_NELNU|nr:TPA_asm: hypothetical protein HUJ06_025965 [Nelumbo nucifera]